MQTMPFPSAEYELISRLQAVLGEKRSDFYLTGIGDDAAVRQGRDGNSIVLTTDLSVENVHFSLGYMSMREAGYRAMVSNLSDCAAMGAVPDSALVQLVVPETGNGDSVGMVEELYRGFEEACSRWDFPIVGGDLSLGEQWVIGITMLGRVQKPERVLLRKGAVSGDTLWVSGYPGRSAAGLALLQKRNRSEIAQQFLPLVNAHIRPVPRIELGRLLAADPAVHAVMDLSDGLSKDCRTLGYENGCGIILSPGSSQIPHEMIQLSREMKLPYEEWFYHGGEDYELLFAASSDFDVSLYCTAETGVAPIRIGQFAAGMSGVVVESKGIRIPLDGGGFDHMRTIL